MKGARRSPAPSASRGDASQPLRVLVVDDSAVVREVLTKLLASEPGLEVTTAGDPIIAMEKMRRSRPDVIVLDLEMPRMDGLTFLRKIMREDPIPVVVCSGVAGRGTDAAFGAMSEGAVDIVHKPSVGLRDFLYESAATFIDVVRAASLARVPARGEGPPPLRRSIPVPPWEPARGTVIAIGASTGGPEAIRTVLDAMPATSPAVLIVQHMPSGFTRAFANRLDASAMLSVKEAEDGDLVAPGRALVAPGNRHLRLVRRGARLVVEVSDGPLVSRHRPSVNVLFRSVAEVAGPVGVGVILTGMGDDGADGLLQMKRAGGSTIAQDEESSVVFGMPAKAIARQAVDEIVPLGEVASAIARLSARRSRA